MKRLTTTLAPLLLLMALLSPVTMAQETTDQPEPTPSQEVIATITPTQVAPPVTTPTDPVQTETDYLLTIIGSIGLIIVLGGSFFLAFKGLQIAGVSVPQEIVDKISDQIVATMKETMTQIGQQVKATPSPIDDAVFAVGRVPVEKLIEEISKRNLTPDQSLKAYQALQQTLDDTGGVFGQGIGANAPDTK